MPHEAGQSSSLPTSPIPRKGGRRHGIGVSCPGSRPPSSASVEQLVTVGRLLQPNVQRSASLAMQRPARRRGRQRRGLLLLLGLREPRRCPVAVARGEDGLARVTGRLCWVVVARPADGLVAASERLRRSVVARPVDGLAGCTGRLGPAAAMRPADGLATPSTSRCSLMNLLSSSFLPVEGPSLPLRHSTVAWPIRRVPTCRPRLSVILTSTPWLPSCNDTVLASSCTCTSRAPPVRDRTATYVDRCMPDPKRQVRGRRLRLLRCHEGRYGRPRGRSCRPGN